MICFVKNKLTYVKEYLDHGLTLKILYVKEKDKFTSRGFIEYIPGEYNWRGIIAPNYLVIHCLWVVGKYKNHGFGSKLLTECLQDAKNTNGVVVMTTVETWLPHNNIFIKNGFSKIASGPNHTELYVLKNKSQSSDPTFTKPDISSLKGMKGMHIFISNQCPYILGMTNHIKKFCKEHKILATIVPVTSCEQAQQGFHPYGTFYYSLDDTILDYQLNTKKVHDHLVHHGIIK